MPGCIIQIEYDAGILNSFAIGNKDFYDTKISTMSTIQEEMVKLNQKIKSIKERNIERKLNIETLSLPYTIATDLKLANILAGLMGHGSNHPRSCEKMRTIGNLKELYLTWEIAGINIIGIIILVFAILLECYTGIMTCQSLDPHLTLFSAVLWKITFLIIVDSIIAYALLNSRFLALRILFIVLLILTMIIEIAYVSLIWAHKTYLRHRLQYQLKFAMQACHPKSIDQWKNDSNLIDEMMNNIYKYRFLLWGVFIIFLLIQVAMCYLTTMHYKYIKNTSIKIVEM
ncbi:hypothetical protein A3Q56_07225 [Intoshia linei]|uniref:Uncharacterized protein n=1 Tax=Intoshia linei TaxID=1819745 RepID=A0A177AT94_9BILA|nr:hypothetical protein A3Q56_07225 [Intoshia linei]